MYINSSHNCFMAIMTKSLLLLVLILAPLVLANEVYNETEPDVHGDSIKDEQEF